ncbi:MAG: hypothetical protein ABW173_04295, partial [Sphingomonas sp.]
RALRRAAAIVPAVLAGWLIHDIAQPPAGVAAPIHFVDEAIASHKALLVRDGPGVRDRAAAYDAEAIRRTIAIRMPRLPADWRVLDARIFPSPIGPGAQLYIALPTGARVGLTAMRIDTPAGEHPRLDRREDENVAYWEEGDTAFALVGQSPSPLLLSLASRLSAEI